MDQAAKNCIGQHWVVDVGMPVLDTMKTLGDATGRSHLTRKPVPTYIYMACPIAERMAASDTAATRIQDVIGFAICYPGGVRSQSDPTGIVVVTVDRRAV